MKHIKMLVAAVIAAVTLTSCEALGLVGAVYTGVTQPAAVTSNAVGTKVGTAKATSILGLAAYGDAGVNAAAKNGNIKKISHVDVKVFSVLGLFSTYEYFVYGE